MPTCQLVGCALTSSSSVVIESSEVEEAGTLVDTNEAEQSRLHTGARGGSAPNESGSAGQPGAIRLAVEMPVTFAAVSALSRMKSATNAAA